MVMAREANASTHDYIQQARARGGVRIIYSDSSVFSSLNMIHALHQNEILALQLDRMLGMSRARLVPFFGTPALFPTGPFVLARLADAPIIPVFVPRLGIRHYGVRVAGPFSIPHERTDPNVIDHVMAAVVREFESVVREFPTQWFQFAPFWPQVPGVDVPFELTLFPHRLASAVIQRDNATIGGGEKHPAIPPGNTLAAPTHLQRGSGDFPYLGVVFP
jgi:lauroyl/myristoyl acyltransferase